MFHGPSRERFRPARIRPRCCNPAHLSRDWAVDLPLLTTLAGRAENRLMSRKRQTKQSREDLRATLLAAGQEILHEEGLKTASRNLTFKRVFERVERESGLRLTNASVIGRVWENQPDYQADVLVSIAQDRGRPEIGLTID